MASREHKGLQLVACDAHAPQKRNDAFARSPERSARDFEDAAQRLTTPLDSEPEDCAGIAFLRAPMRLAGEVP